jgi:hypothetical protein
MYWCAGCGRFLIESEVVHHEGGVSECIYCGEVVTFVND